jgi:uncharacterized phage protein (TIGR01671 family)
MNREILFRGKRVDTGEWAYGYYVNCSGPGCQPYETRHYIMEYPDKWREVYTATVGQYTGLKDRNEKRIFEGDIIKARQAFCGELLCRGVVEYRNLRWEVPEDDFVVEESSLIEYEVIGNIYDNPELC